MFVYLIIYIILMFLALSASKQKKYSYIILTTLCIIVFLREKTVGTDITDYSINFRKMNWNESTWNHLIPFEPGFNYFICFFKHYISNNPMICWGTIGVIYVICFYKFAKKYTNNINIALLSFYLLGTYFLVFNIMRQCFACAILLLIFTYINIEKPSPKNIIISIISIFFIGLLLHPTMYIFYTYLLYHLKPIKYLLTKKFMILLIGISFIIFYTQAIIPFLASLIDSSSAEGKLINYAIRNIQNGENSGFSILKILLITSFQIYLIIASPKVQNIFLFMGTCGVIFLNCFGILVVEFARVYELFMCLQIIYLSQIWTTIKNNKIGLFFKPILLLYLTIIFINILIKNYGEIVPYHFRSLI